MKISALWVLSLCWAVISSASESPEGDPFDLLEKGKKEEIQKSVLRGVGLILR